MSLPLCFARDATGENTFADVISDATYGAQLSAGTAQSLVVPQIPNKTFGTRYLAIFSINPGGTVFMSTDRSSGVTNTAIPFTGTMGSVKSIMNPTPRVVYPGDTLSFITQDTNAYIGVELYVVK